MPDIGFVVGADCICYIRCMFLQHAGWDGRLRPLLTQLGLRRVVLDDHARLPWRFFGRLTAAVRANRRG